MKELKINISVVQFQPELADPLASISRLKLLFSRLPESNLVILPELSNSGYNFKNFDEAWECSEVIGQSGSFQDFLAEQAIKRKAYIVSGINEREGDKLYNTAILVGPEGMAGKYRKMHLFMNEKDIFTPGITGLPVFDLGGYRIGIQICFDYFFPEPWRILAQQGADLICHPSNILTSNPRKVLPALALMNRVYIATANRTGTENDITFNGQSMIIDPYGNVLKTASVSEAETLTCDIYPGISRNKMITARNHAFNDRLPDSYHF